jgi:MFS family permease
MTASGCGALLGALYLAGRRSIAGLGQVIPAAGVVFGLGLMAFAYSRVLWLSVLLLVVAGFGSMVQIASSNTLLQTIVDDNKRGRVMSFFLMAYFGTTPFGSLIAGSLSDRYGAPVTLAFGGACCVAGAIWFAMTLSSIEHQFAPAYVRVDG